MRNPFKDITDKATEHNRIMQQWMAGYATGQEHPRGHSDAWLPAIDVLMQHDGDLVILVELPGVRQEDIDLSISGGDLTVYGEKDGRREEAEYYTRERYFGTFRRTISLPDGLSEDRISCRFEGCLLVITIRDYADILEEKRLEIGNADG